MSALGPMRLGALVRAGVRGVSEYTGMVLGLFVVQLIAAWGAGLVIFILGTVGMTRKRQVVETVRVAADPATGQQVTERKTSAPR